MAKTCQKVPKGEKKRQKSTTTEKCVKVQPSITTMMGVQSSKVLLWEVVLYLLESGDITCSGEVLRGDWTSTKTYYK